MAQNKKLSIKPLSDRVVVKPFDASEEKRLPSGIIIPETVKKEKLFEGKVMAIGPGRLNDSGGRIPMEVKVGDVVLFKKPWDEPVKLDGEEYFVLSESEITLIKE